MGEKEKVCVAFTLAPSKLTTQEGRWDQGDVLLSKQFGLDD